MGNGKEATNARSLSSKAAGRLSISTHEGMEFTVAFNKRRERGKGKKQVKLWSKWRGDLVHFFALCPLPFALCPLPFALCPLPFARLY
jgi:hypothetical protein